MITYKKSGVDIERANLFVRNIQKDIKKTLTSGVLANVGGFGSLFELKEKYKNPVFVSSTDGVGTKLLVAKELNKHDTVGIDLVAMNVNDVLCMGAKPLFFLDYVACGKVDVKVLSDVVKGIADGCRQAGCALIGGETAEMPGMYKKDDYDLAGFCVGVVEKNKIINGIIIREGDLVIGIESSGLHSNGYSLVRKVLSKQEIKKYGDIIIKPTKIYVKPILSILRNNQIKGIAHVTGGAFYDKVNKILPKNLNFEICKNSWPVPEIFKLIKDKSGAPDKELYRTLNMGIGLILVVEKNSAQKIINELKVFELKSWVIGKVIKGNKQTVII
ncbi:MAG: phosphoribosylformylglycinamidine cyclo-ligase [Candidatus Omnitrophota bacterium]